MAVARQQAETTILVHWTYSREEWKRFLKWKSRKKGLFHYMLYVIRPKRNAQIPYVVVTYNEVCTDDIYEAFHNSLRKLNRVSIHDAGKMNVMEITYEKETGRHTVPVNIYMPVPKGKLREAIELQENLLSHYYLRC